jgi:hypothetical protein
MLPVLLLNAVIIVVVAAGFDFGCPMVANSAR